MTATNRIARMIITAKSIAEMTDKFATLYRESDEYGVFNDDVFDDRNVTRYNGWTILSFQDGELYFMDDDMDTYILFNKTGSKYEDIRFVSTDALPSWVKIEI